MPVFHMIRSSAPPIRFLLPPSSVLTVALLLLVLAAGVALWLSALPRWVLMLLPLFAVLGWRGLRRGLPLELVLRGDGTAVQQDVNGNSRPVELLALHERGPLGVLVLESDGRRIHLPWAGDSLPRALRRDIRLWLRRHAATLRDPAGRRPAASSTGMTGSG